MITSFFCVYIIALISNIDRFILRSLSTSTLSEICFHFQYSSIVEMNES